MAITMSQTNITFKPEFIATMYPGYFFNTEDEKLYSMKIDGVLKPLKFYKPNPWNHLFRHPLTLKTGEKVYTKGGYYVSFRGRRKFYAIEHLKELAVEPHVIPVKEAVNG